jgi:hypothetical protein
MITIAYLSAAVRSGTLGQVRGPVLEPEGISYPQQQDSDEYIIPEIEKRQYIKKASAMALASTFT